jgi:hypothetical protein
MRSGNSPAGKNPFVAAQDLVACWVIAGEQQRAVFLNGFSSLQEQLTPC